MDNEPPHTLHWHTGCATCRRANHTLDATLQQVAIERAAQDAKFGEQNHRDGTNWADRTAVANAARTACDKAFKENRGTWRHVLLEEVYEALAESDPAKLRAELVRVAAVAVAWVQAIDRRNP